MNALRNERRSNGNSFLDRILFARDSAMRLRHSVVVQCDSEIIMQVSRLSIRHLTAAGCFIFCPTLALALVENPMPLEQVLKDSDEIFVAHFDRIDTEKP